MKKKSSVKEAREQLLAGKKEQYRQAEERKKALQRITQEEAEKAR